MAANKLHIIFVDNSTSILEVDIVEYHTNYLYYQLNDTYHAIPWAHIKEVTSTVKKPNE